MCILKKKHLVYAVAIAFIVIGSFNFIKTMSLGPSETVLDFAKEMKQGHMEKAKKRYLTKKHLRVIGAFKDNEQANGWISTAEALLDSNFNNSNAVVLSEKVSGGKATVQCKVTKQQSTLCKMNFALVKEYGQWKIASYSLDYE